MDPIRMNILNLTWNPEEISKRYDIFIIESNEKKYWSRLTFAADKIFDAGIIQSICYLDSPEESSDDKRRIYILLNKDASNEDRIDDYVRSLGDDFSATPIIDMESFIKRKERILAQLFLNALQTDSPGDHIFEIVTGKYYCIDSKWVRKNGTRLLEFRIDPVRGMDEGLVLNMSLRNVNRISVLGKLDNDDFAKLMNGPQYDIDNLHLKRVYNSSKNNMVFRQRIVNGHRVKDSMAYVDANDYERFKKTKVFYLFNALRLFNARYASSNGPMLARMDLVHLQETDSRKFKPSTIEAFVDWIKGLIVNERFIVIDLAKDEDSKSLVDDLVSFLSSHGSDVKVSDHPDHDAYNICVLHESDYYEDPDNDPHDKFLEYGVQHITVEGYKPENIAMLAMVIAKELAIKKDLLPQNRKITVDDWSKYHFNGDLTFVSVSTVGKKDSKRIFLYQMTVHPDGTFDIDGKEVTSKPDDELSALWLAESHADRGILEGLITDSKGNINAIRRTNIVTVPEDSMESELKKGIKIRNKYGKEHLYQSELDLRLLNSNGSMFYYSGFLNFQEKSLKTVPNVRRVDPLKGDLFFADLIDLMNVPFVKYKFMTVKPYPFKYLDEYRCMIGLEPKDFRLESESSIRTD